MLYTPDQNGSLPMETGYYFRATNLIFTDPPCVFKPEYHDFRIIHWQISNPFWDFRPLGIFGFWQIPPVMCTVSNGTRTQTYRTTSLQSEERQVGHANVNLDIDIFVISEPKWLKFGLQAHFFKVFGHAKFQLSTSCTIKVIKLLVKVTKYLH